MMDFENWILEHKWGNREQPKGDKRHEDDEWSAMIQTRVYPHHSDVDWGRLGRTGWRRRLVPKRKLNK